MDKNIEKWAFKISSPVVWLGSFVFFTMGLTGLEPGQTIAEFPYWQWLHIIFGIAGIIVVSNYDKLMKESGKIK